MKHHPNEGKLRFFWLCLVAFILGGCALTPSSANTTPTKPTPRLEPSPSPSSLAATPCQTQHLQLALDTKAAATSNEGMQLVLLNQSKQRCTLSGYPALHLQNSRHQPIQADIKQSLVGYLYTTHAPHRFVLEPGGKAYFVVEWANLGCGKLPPGAGPPGSFASSVSFLLVMLPPSQDSLLVAVQFCPFRNILEISPLMPNKVLGVFV
ncbi:DUF4232 domain-containing protein [Ktedonosporobacter rubrisoli]